MNLADRFATALMAVVLALTQPALVGDNPALPIDPTQTFLSRVMDLVTRLISISNFGVRPPAATAPAMTPAARAAPKAPGQPPPRPTGPQLPRHRGWLLDALPDAAPAIAADIVPLLSDPALTDLLAAAPSMRPVLRKLLRGLDLALPQPPPPDAPPSPQLVHAPHLPLPPGEGQGEGQCRSNDCDPSERAQRQNSSPCQTSSHVHFVTI